MQRFLRRPFVRRVFPAVPRALLSLVSDEVRYASLVAAVHGADQPMDRRDPFFGRDTAPREIPPANEDRLIPELAGAYLSATATLQAGVPAAYQANNEWRNYLDAGWRRYRDALRGGSFDELARLLRSYFRNEGIAGIWADRNVFETFRDLRGAAALFSAGQMMRQYLVWRELCPQSGIQELEAPAVGNPWGYRFGDALVYQPAFEYHFQARHLQNLLGAHAHPVVMEIGGGFGGLAYQLRRARPGVRYLGFDLPENLLIQDYTLSVAFPGARILRYSPAIDTLRRSLFEEYDVILMPNFMLPRAEAGLADLVINVRSLSEMGADTVAEYFAQIARLCRRFFFHENLSAPRLDGYFGLTCDSFPSLPGFIQVAAHESRWPRYQRDSAYPCREELYLRSDAG
jgi:hypothetical protein